jgi:hypothetical protein
MWIGERGRPFARVLTHQEPVDNCLLCKTGSTPGRESMRSSDGAVTPIPITAQKSLFDPVGEINSVHRRISSAWRVTPVFSNLVEPIGSGPVFRANQDLIRCLHQFAILSRKACDESRATLLNLKWRPASQSGPRLGSHGATFLSARAGVAGSDGRA